MGVGAVSGVIHVGAHEAEEIPYYLHHGISRVLWVEANPELQFTIQQKINPYPYMTCAIFAAGEIPMDSAKLNVASNGHSSSMLSPKLHLLEHPEIEFVRSITTKIIPIDSYMSNCGYRLDCYDLLVLDVQGYELHALRGAIRQLQYIKYIITEVNDSEIYSGCVTTPQLDKFLESFGFSRSKTWMTKHGWGDALYVRV